MLCGKFILSDSDVVGLVGLALSTEKRSLGPDSDRGATRAEMSAMCRLKVRAY